MKKCNNPNCHSPSTQPISNFNKNKNKNDGLSNRCKTCVIKSVKQSYIKNREYYCKIESERNKIWRMDNPEKYKTQRNTQNTRLKESGYWLKYYQENKERILDYSKQDHIAERRNERWRERYKNDIPFKLRNIMKANFHLFFKDRGKNKDLSFTKITSYTFEQLALHLEDKFREGMCWENFGVCWEIHHIKPQNMFDVMDIKEVEECWSLPNLFPLWKTTSISLQFGDNIRGNRNIKKNEIYNPLLDI
jgi:hypothetical protein